MRLQMPSVSFVVARSRDTHVIGRDNRLPWRLPSDLARFKALTIGHAVIMGRRTHASIGRPLPGRLNIVLSRNPGGGRAGAPDAPHGDGLAFAGSPDEALALADRHALRRGDSEVFVIGGDAVYRLFADLADTVYLTEVDAAVEGDARFALDLSAPAWTLQDRTAVAQAPGDEFPSAFLRLRRTTPRQRFGSTEAGGDA